VRRGGVRVHSVRVLGVGGWSVLDAKAVGVGLAKAKVDVGREAGRILRTDVALLGRGGGDPGNEDVVPAGVGTRVNRVGTFDADTVARVTVHTGSRAGDIAVHRRPKAEPQAQRVAGGGVGIGHDPLDSRSVADFIASQVDRGISDRRFAEEV